MSSYNNPNDPNYLGDRDIARRDRTGNFWPWVIGLLVLLAVGWIVIEAFDKDDAVTDYDATPAAGEIRDEPRDLPQPPARDQDLGVDRSGDMDAQPQQNRTNDNIGGGGAP